jgi:hypothetical protein
MDSSVSRILAAGLFFLFIFISGFWLSRLGKPYAVVIFTIHKLLALGALLFLGRLVYLAQHTAPLQGLPLLVIAITAICLLTLFVTGALVSLDKAMPAVLLKLHHALPYLSVAAAGSTLFLLL